MRYKKEILKILFILIILSFSVSSLNTPTNLTATPISSSEIRLKWDDILNETSYKIERSINNINFTEVGSVSENTTAYSDTGLNANTTYYYKIKATNSQENSSYSSIVSARTNSSQTQQTNPVTNIGILNISLLENNTEGRAYRCLDNQINNKTSLSLQEAIFSALALGNKEKAVDKIEKERNGNCWPKAGCTIKETAQALLVYYRLGKNGTDIENWLLSKNKTIDKIKWYLEIHLTNRESGECVITYDNEASSETFKINNDMVLEGISGSCFSIDPSGYWLAISENCFNKEFTIKCNKDFLTTLLYKKAVDSKIIFVSSKTSAAPSDGTTTEKIVAYCLTTGAECDYEGTLWASLALARKNNINPFLPYLLVRAEENTKYLSSAFLFYLTGSNEEYNNLVKSQRQNKFWEQIETPYNKYYDTAVAFLGLSGGTSQQVENAKAYLANVATKEGCWNNNNIRDTAFLLWAGWPRLIGGTTSIPIEQPTGPSIPQPRQSCTSRGYYCVSSISSCTENDGIVYEYYECPVSLICCSKDIEKKRCSEFNGVLCNSTQICNGNEVSAKEGSCCIGVCVIRETTPSTPTREDRCTPAGGVCRGVCDLDEEEITEDCSSASEVCCKKKTTETTTKKTGISTWLIVLLIVLILIVIIAIIFRNKIQTFLFRFRKTTKPVTPYSPGEIRPLGPRPPPMMMPPRQTPVFNRGISKQTPNQAPRIKSPKEDEMEETLRKLKEINE